MYILSLWQAKTGKQENEKMQISLKKIISKKEVSAILEEIIKATNSPVIIEDEAGKVLKGYSKEVHTNRHPVKVSDDVIGWVVGDKESSAIASLLCYLADRELEKKMLVKETLEKYKEITLLYNIAEKVSACLDLKEVAKLAIDETMKFIDGTGASIKLLNDETGQFETIISFGSESDTKTLRPGEGIEGNVFTSGMAEIVNDVYSDARYVACGSKVSSIICSPLKVKDKVIGTIKISSDEPINYMAEHLKLLCTIASQAASAIENARLYDELKETFFTVVHALAETIEKRDPYTGGHTNRVMDYSLAIGKELGLSEDEMTNLRLSAILHDIGKIGVRDSVLLKEGKLTDEEFTAIKMHSIYGEQILKHVKQMRDVIAGVKYHHERYDGRGYPDGLKGEEIPITARIIAVADTFDAMTSDRPYRKGLSLDIAFEELRKHSGTQFDAKVVEVFLKAHEKKNV
jgi:HD-GYP domain-containing protein (c-di-GMP phosphodiesterase class II)